MKANDIREKNGAELRGILAELRKDIMNFRLRVATGVVDNNRECRNKKRDIARINTVLRERELAAAKGTKKS